MVHHQRISAASYCFSAGLPALLATAASETIGLLRSDEGKDMIRLLRENAGTMRGVLVGQRFATGGAGVPGKELAWLECEGPRELPLLVVRIREEVVRGRGWERAEEEKVIGEVVDEVGCFVPP